MPDPSVVDQDEIIWAAGTDPAAQDVNIDATTTQAYMLWTYWANADGSGLSSATLGGNSYDGFFELTTTTAGFMGIGVARFDNPSSGNQSLDITWDTAPAEGATTIVVQTKDGKEWDNTPVGDQETSTNATSATVTCESGNLILRYEANYDSGTPWDPPGLESGFTNVLTGGNTNQGCRASSLVADATSETGNGQNENYNGLLLIPIPAGTPGGGGGGGGVNLLTLLGVG